MESKASKDVSSHSLLPPSIKESCRGQPTGNLCYRVDDDNSPGETRTTAQAARCANEILQEKSLLTDVPLNSKQLAMIYKKEIPPPYEANPSQQTVWSTEASKVHPGRPRIVGRDTSVLNILCCRLIVFVSIFAALYICNRGLSSIITNYDTARKIDIVQNEVLRAVNVVFDPYNIQPKYERTLIHVIGPLSVSEPLKYDECNVSVSSVILRRTFDRSHLYTKVSNEKPYFMSEKWSETRLGEDQICPTSELEYGNPLSLQNEEKIADEVKIGSFKLGHRLKEKFDEFVITSDKLLEVDSDQAIRVMYSDAGRNGNDYSVMGQLVEGTIEPYELLDYYTIILQRESRVSAYNMITDRVIYRLKELDEENWWMYIMVGLGVLMPVIAILHYRAVMKAMKKHKRNHLMLSIPVE